MEEEPQTIKLYVESVLREDPRARSDDKWLIILVLRKMMFNIYIPYDKLKDIPSFETITRFRRKFQENGQYTAKEEIVHQRAINEAKMRDINHWWNGTE